MLVENSEWDRDLFVRACRRCNLPHPLVVLTDGLEAMQYFEGAHPYSDRARHPFPMAVFIDLQMPEVTGLELLAWMQRRTELDRVARIVLTDSALFGEKTRCSDLGASHFLSKPTRFDQLADLISNVRRWLQAAQVDCHPNARLR